MEKFRPGDYVKSITGEQGIMVDSGISPNGWIVRVDFYGETRDVPLKILQHSTKEEWEYIKKMRGLSSSLLFFLFSSPPKS